MKHNMYPHHAITVLLLGVTFGLTSCEGPVGPTGEPGADGQDGVPGMTVQLVPPGHFLSFREDASLLILTRHIAVPSLTLSVLGAGAVFVQVKDGPMLPFEEILPVGSVQHNYSMGPGFIDYWLIGSPDVESTARMPRPGELRIVTIEPILE